MRDSSRSVSMTSVGIAVAHLRRRRRPRTPCPTTAASASSDFASGVSVSSRAAISACTESGNGTSAPSRSSQLDPLRTSRSLSLSRRTNSSAYSGLPPARSRIGCCSSAGITLASSSAETSRAVSSGDRGARLIGVALRRPLPIVGVAARNSSGRAVPTISSGTPSARPARCSRNASIASSAQCRSSNTSTVGSCSAMCSRNRRHAVNSSSRSAEVDAPIPSSGSRRWRNQARSSPSGSTTSSLAMAVRRVV